MVEKAGENKSEVAAQKIQGLYQRLKVYKEFKELRNKLKSTPFVVRNSLVKMHWLKRETGNLMFETNTLVGVKRKF
jgi:hypothetical protein